MNSLPSGRRHRPRESANASACRRRYLLGVGATLGAALIAGCATGSSGNDNGGYGPPAGDDEGAGTPTGPSGGTRSSGGFRLLISDQPVAIGEFDRLDVSFDRARIFPATGSADAEGGSPEDASTPTPEPDTAAGTATPAPTDTDDESATVTGNATPAGTVTETEEEDADESGGFVVLDLGGATVDLTQVVGEKAIGVFDGELPAGRYTKIELSVAGVEGVVDGGGVQVTVPSDKLQIVKPFEVVAGDTVSFVFDINVVKRGRSGGYNLLPVISESGVAGKDVAVEEIEAGTRAAGGDGSRGGDGRRGDDEDADAGQGDGSGREGRGDQGGNGGNAY